MKVTRNTRRVLAQRRNNRERRAASSPPQTGPMRKEGGEPWRLRRWENAADTNRLNQAQWQFAYGRTINEDLYERLESLRIRCEHHIARDPILEGVVSTFSGDVVGPSGPAVQVQSDDARFNEYMEEAIAEYHERPDPHVDATMADVLRVDVRSLCTAGEFLHQFTHARRRGPFAFAIRSPHPRRLETPTERVGLPQFFMGMELNAQGGVERYHLRDEPPGLFARTSLHYRAIEAQNMQHKFIRNEPDQLRGFPWLAVALEDMGDRIQLNKHVMEAAKIAASQALFWYTDHPAAMIDFQFATSGQSHPIEAGMQQVGPPGYKPQMLQPTQPGPNWKEFDHERIRGYGRPFGMPLMMILLSSEGNSFSGANHDGQIYIRSVGGLQTWLQCGTLTPQYHQIASEVAITTGRPRPKRLKYDYTWTLPPHPDPKKNYEALRMQLEDGAISLNEVCGKLGREFESVAAARAYVNGKLDELGLPRPPINVGDATDASRVLRDVADSLDKETEDAEEREPQTA